MNGLKYFIMEVTELETTNTYNYIHISQEQEQKN